MFTSPPSDLRLLPSVLWLFGSLPFRISASQRFSVSAFAWQHFSVSAFQLFPQAPGPPSAYAFCIPTVVSSQWSAPVSSEAQLLEEFNRRDDGNAEGFLQDQQIAILSDEE